MSPRNGASLAADGDQQEARRGDLLGGSITAEATYQHASLQGYRAPTGRAAGLRALRTILIGSNQATADSIAARGHAPALGLCRALIEAGHDPNTPLEAYRGTTLCLRVRSIGEGARLTVKETTRDGKPRFVAYRPGPDGAGSVRGQPYIAQTAEEAVLQAADHDGEAVLGGV
jgi:hypothetical protein